MTEKTYLITGVAGFIASRTAEFLLREGHHVLGVDTCNDYYDVRLKTNRLQKLVRTADPQSQVLNELDPSTARVDRYMGPKRFESGRFQFVHLDIENKKALSHLFSERKIDAVVNLAARAGVRYSMEHPEVYMSTNAMGTLHLLEAMRTYGCSKLVLASTSSLYAGQPMPFKEDLPVNEPISPYAASKKAAEMMAYTYSHLYDIDVSILRYFTVYGPAGRPDMATFRFIKWIDEGTPIQMYGDGSQTRDFTYVDDIAYGTIAALQPVGYEVINLGGGNRPIDLNELIAFIENGLGKKANINHLPFHKADLKETSAEISKAERLLSWKPVTPPEQGFQKTLDWYVSNRAWLKDVEV